MMSQEELDNAIIQKISQILAITYEDCLSIHCTLLFKVFPAPSRSATSAHRGRSADSQNS